MHGREGGVPSTSRYVHCCVYIYICIRACVTRRARGKMRRTREEEEEERESVRLHVCSYRRKCEGGEGRVRDDS